MKRVTIILFVILSTGLVFGQTVSEYDQNLIKCLKNENVGIRSSAAQLLGERRVNAAVEPLIEVVKKDKDKRVKVVAAIALYTIGDPKAIPALKEFSKKVKNKSFAHVVSSLVMEMEKEKYVKK